MFKLSSFYLGLFLSFLFLSVRIYAQPAPPVSSAPQVTAADAAEGKRHFKTGLKLLKEKVYSGALIEFEESYRLGGRWSALLNYAQTLRELKRFAEAYEAFEKVLVVHGAQLKVKTKGEVRQALVDLGLVTATIWLNVNEEGAEVMVEDESVGLTPLSKPIRVNIGQHKIKVKKSEFIPIEKEVEVSGKQVLTLELKLEREVQTGHVRIKEKNGVEIEAFLDGKSIGSVPWEGEVEVGSHAIKLRGSDLRAPKQSFEVEKGKEYELVLEAKPLTATLRVTASPPEASILIDQVKVGTGKWEGEFPVGHHVLEVSASDYETYRQELDLKEGKPAVQNVSLTPEEDEYTGSYGQISLLGAFGLKEDPLSQCKGVNCNNTSPMGAGLGFRFGYAWSYVSLEGAFLFMGDYRSEENNYSTGGNGGKAYKEIFRTPSINTFIGVGPRFTSPGSSARFTVAVTPGVAYRHFIPFREIKDGSDYSVAGQKGYAAFAMVSEIGVLFGDTFGSEFMIGFSMWMDFPSEEFRFDLTHVQRKIGNPDYFVLKDEAQIYIGPTLGVRFGH